MQKKQQFLILLAIALAALCNYLPIPHMDKIVDLLSTLFLNALKLLSLPMIFLAIISTITTRKSVREMSHIARKVVLYTCVTTLIAASIGLICFLIFASPLKTVGVTGEIASIHYLDFIKNIVPENITRAFLDGNVIAIAFIASILGIAIMKMPEKERDLFGRLFKGLFQAFLTISTWLIRFLPLGIFAFAYPLFGALSSEMPTLKKLGGYALAVLFANLLQGFIVLPLFLKKNGLSPLHSFKKILPALSVAFFSKSSNAALPLTLKCAQEDLGVRPKTAQFTLPLCSVINMNGCAAFILITTLFVAASSGIYFSIWQMLLWIPIATLAAIGNAGIPMGCYFLTSALLMGMNVPLHMMGLILPLYAFFDMVETALNVWSDSCVTSVTDHKLKEAENKVVKV